MVRLKRYLKPLVKCNLVRYIASAGHFILKDIVRQCSAGMRYILARLDVLALNFAKVVRKFSFQVLDNINT